MRKVFVSYARVNRPDVDQLVAHLGVLGCQAWVDSSLHGGQDWWDVILQAIADTDVFLPIISRDALNSSACGREFDWAEALGKPVLPVAVEPPPKALPARFSKRQIIDYSDQAQRDRAAVILGGGLMTLPVAPPLPQPLPDPPAAPLSYLTELVDVVSRPTLLDHEQQRHILFQLESAARSVDPHEREGCRDILERFSSRDDLFFDVGRTIDRLKLLSDQSVPATETESRPGPPSPPTPDSTTKIEPQSEPATPAKTDSTTRTEPRPVPPTPISEPRPEKASPPRAERPLKSSLRQNTLLIAGALLAVSAAIGIIGGAKGSPNGYYYRYFDDFEGDYEPILHIAAGLSSLVVGISFSLLAWRAKTHSQRSVMICAWVAAAGTLVLAVSQLLGLLAEPKTLAIFVALSSVTGTAFAVALIRSKTGVKWASLLIFWGLCGMVEALSWFLYGEWLSNTIGYLVIVQNVTLLAVGILMYRESRLAEE